MLKSSSADAREHKRRLSLPGIILLFLTLAGLLTGCHTADNQDITLRMGGDQSVPPGEPVVVSASVTPKMAMDGPVEVWFELPSTAAFISGDTYWRGELAEGETHELRATIAIVTRSSSMVLSRVRYPHPTKVSGFGEELEGMRIETGADGGRTWPWESPPTPTPIPVDGPALDGGGSYWPPEFATRDGSGLYNTGDSPRLLVITSQEGVDALVEQGLLPSSPPSLKDGTRWDLFVDGVGNETFAVALYDRQRPTTGYHLSLLRRWSGYTAHQLTGVDHNDHPVIALEVAYTAPREDWPVEQGPVSPMQVHQFGYGAFGDGSLLEIALFVNGYEERRYMLDRDEMAEPVFELPLPPLEVRALG